MREMRKEGVRERGGVRNGRGVGGGGGEGGHTGNSLLFVSLCPILTLAIFGAIHSLMLLTPLHIHRTAFGA